MVWFHKTAVSARGQRYAEDEKEGHEKSLSRSSGIKEMRTRIGFTFPPCKIQQHPLVAEVSQRLATTENDPTVEKPPEVRVRQAAAEPQPVPTAPESEDVRVTVGIGYRFHTDVVPS